MIFLGGQACYLIAQTIVGAAFNMQIIALRYGLGKIAFIKRETRHDLTTLNKHYT